MPTSAVTDFAQSHALKVIPLSGPEIDELRRQQPYYAAVPLPANTYKGQAAAVPTLAVMSVWTAHADVPEPVAYEVTKALFENLAVMGQVHVQGKNISLANATAVGTAPIHPGALRYFKERARSSDAPRAHRPDGGVPDRAAPAAAPARQRLRVLLQAHRSGQALARLPLNPAEPEVRIAFEHSVLGTTVTDRYRFAPQAWLVEEVFEGQGYGLPHTAGPANTCGARASAGT